MKKVILIVVMFVSVFVCQRAFGAATEVAGTISNVIVYRGEALVTRTIEADLPKGTSEMIVTNLPEKIKPESLYAQGPGDVTILSVRYRERAVKEDTREEVKKLDAQIAKVSRKLKHADRDRQHNSNVYKRYDPYWKLTIDTVNSDLDRGLLQFEPIEKLTGYLEGKYDEAHNKGLQLEDEVDDIKKELDLLKRKREQLSAGHSRTQREAVVYLTKSDSKAISIELNYLVSGANWTPQYNLRANPDKSKTLIEYNAVVHQSSGESWKETTLALSTAQPSLVASPPVLEAMEISLMEIMMQGNGPRGRMGGMAGDMPQAAMEQIQSQSKISYKDQTQQFSELLQKRTSSISKGAKAQKELNVIALDNQFLELNADRKALEKMNTKMARIRRTEGVSVMYKVPGKLTLPSRSDQQLLTIATINAKADFTLLASPLLTDYVYLQGEILNDSDTILLPGPASMYRNGEFVGKGNMDLVTIGQKFTTGFGIDSQVQVTRQFKDKKTETLWGNRVDEQSYEITINNYKNNPLKLRLMERLPYTENPNIEIVLLKPSHPLSKDAEYLRTQRKKSILRWDLDLKSNTTGEKAEIVKYGFTMKYDNDMRIEPVKHNQ